MLIECAAEFSAVSAELLALLWFTAATGIHEVVNLV